MTRHRTMLQRARDAVLQRARDAVRAFGAPPAYEGASASARATAFGSLMGQASAAMTARPTLAARARWLVANTAVGASIAGTFVTHLIGDAPSIRSGHYNRAMRRAIEAEFARLYARLDIEAGDLCSLLQRVVHALVTDGECFVRLLTTDDGELRCQLLPADQIDASINMQLADGGVIISGIEYDRNGTPRAYYILPTIPDAFFASSEAAVRVEAADICHVFEPRFPGQRRGISWLHAVLTRLVELDQVEDAAIVKARVSAALCGFLTDMEGFEYRDDDLKPTDDPNTSQLFMEPGTIRKLRTGQDVKFSPVADMTALDAFLKYTVRSICSAVGVPYSLVSADLADVNFSSSRVGLHHWQRRCGAVRASVLTARLLEPLWRRMVTLAILSGRINADLARDGEALFSMVAMWPQWPQISPREDTEADALAVANGFRSRQEIVSARGRDVEDVDAEIAADTFRPREPATVGVANAA